MSDSPILPGSHAWRDASGKPLPLEFYKFLRDMVRFVSQSDGNAASVIAILERLAAIEEALSQGPAASLTGTYSVQTLGALATGMTVQLRGDVGNPDPGNVYSFLASKGWHALADFLSAGNNVSIETVDGVSTINAAAYLPLTTGEVPAVLVCLDDGSLVYVESDL